MGRYLITGGCGFIGTALAKRLKSIGSDVVLIDLDDKIKDFHKDNFICFSLDIRDYKNFAKLSDLKFDCIFHLAAQTSGRISEENPDLDIDTNIKGTLNLLKYMTNTNNKKIIFTSSMAVYGNDENPIDENKPVNPLSNYAVSKIAGESYLKMYKQYGITYTIFRLFNVYGRGQDLSNMKQGMVSIYIAQAVKSNVIDVTGSIDRYRDFVHIDDVINALVMPLNNKKMSENIYNVGTGVKTTVKELINIIQSIKGSTLKINCIESHQGDQFGTFANIQKLRTLGWKPCIQLNDDNGGGIKDMFDWAVNNG